MLETILGIALVLYILIGFYMTAVISARFQEATGVRIEWYYKIIAVIFGIFWILTIAISLIILSIERIPPEVKNKKKQSEEKQIGFISRLK
jgi:nitrate reductase gamma subunit